MGDTGWSRASGSPRRPSHNSARLNPMPPTAAQSYERVGGQGNHAGDVICVVGLYEGQVPYFVFLFGKQLEGEDALLDCEGCRGVASSPSNCPARRPLPRRHPNACFRILS